MASLSVSIVIPVHNGGTDLQKCLDAIAASSYPVCECIVVDDASTDGLTGQVAELHGARVIHLEKRRGPALARNIGVGEAVGDLIFFVDSDVLVHPDTLEVAVHALESSPETAAVFGSYDDEPGHRSFLSQYRNLFHHWVHQTSHSEASTFWSGCGLIRRKIFLEMGGFKTSYQRPSIEDIELGSRMYRSGLRIRLEKNMLCTHLKRWTFWNMVSTDIFKRGAPWMVLLLEDHDAPRDLNLSNRSRFATVLAGVLALSAMVLLLAGHAAALVPAAVFLSASLISASIAGKSSGAYLLTPALAILPTAAACYLAPDPLAAIPLALILLLVLTHLGFYRYTAQKRNFAFAFAIIPMQVIFFLGCVLSAALGFVQYFFAPGEQPFRTRTLPMIVLILVALLAYANAWPDRLIWDDAVFATGNRLLGVSFTDIQHYFTDDVWAAVGAETGLYRPLLLSSVALDIQLFGDWVAGFHLINIFLHVLVTLTVYGLIRYLLPVCGCEPAKSNVIALLAALVFAVHPVHTEVVNSIFNRSEMLVSLGVVGGLWWFLPTVKNQPWKAWGLLGLIYLLVMLCRETGIVLPAITVVFLWITTEGNWQLRLRKCLPVLWLLIPLAIYLGMRAHALDTPPAHDQIAAQAPAVDQATPDAAPRGTGEQKLPVPEIAAQAPAVDQATPDSAPWSIDKLKPPPLGLFFNPANTLPAFAVWFESIRLMLWPHPLITFHDKPTTNVWLALVAQLTLLGFAVVLLLRKRPGLFLGLAFFYLSILPSSRIVGEYTSVYYLAERHLYMPSVGITIVLAFGLGWLAQRFTLKTAAVPILIVLVLLAPLTWARNALWTSNVRLAQADYNSSGHSEKVLPVLVNSLLAKDDFARAGALCDKHSPALLDQGLLADNCAQVYVKLGRFGSAEQAYISATNDKDRKSPAHYGLAVMYAGLNRKNEAVEQFELAIANEKKIFMREYLSAEMLMRLYPTDQIRMLEAKSHLETALQLQPQFNYARKKLDILNRRLNPADREHNAR